MPQLGKPGKPKKKKVTEKPEDMPAEAWEDELVRRKAMTADRSRRRVIAKERKNAAIAEAAAAAYVAAHAGKTVASHSGKSVARGATQESSTAGSSRPRSPSSPDFFHEPALATSRSQTRFSSPEVGESEVPVDPHAVFSPSTTDPDPRRGVGVDLNHAYSGSPAMRRSHLIGVDASASVQTNRTLFGGRRNVDHYVLDEMQDATPTEVSALFHL